jgi:hypothetical protein
MIFADIQPPDGSADLCNHTMWYDYAENAIWYLHWTGDVDKFEWRRHMMSPPTKLAERLVAMRRIAGLPDISIGKIDE